MSNFKRGFTSTGPLVVIAILAFLVAIVAIAFSKNPSTGNNTGTDSSLQSTEIAGQKIPQPTGYVNDVAGVLSKTTISDNEKKLKAFSSQGGAAGEIAVLVVPSLNGLSIEEYGIRVAEAWHVGQFGIDNAEILIISTGDRKVRIETGSGSRITDSQAAQIISTSIVPSLKKNDWDGGVNNGVNAIIKAVLSN